LHGANKIIKRRSVIHYARTWGYEHVDFINYLHRWLLPVGVYQILIVGVRHVEPLQKEYQKWEFTVSIVLIEDFSTISERGLFGTKFTRNRKRMTVIDHEHEISLAKQLAINEHHIIENGTEYEMVGSHNVHLLSQADHVKYIDGKKWIPVRELPLDPQRRRLLPFVR